MSFLQKLIFEEPVEMNPNLRTKQLEEKSGENRDENVCFVWENDEKSKKNKLSHQMIKK